MRSRSRPAIAQCVLCAVLASLGLYGRPAATQTGSTAAAPAHTHTAPAPDETAPAAPRPAPSAPAPTVQTRFAPDAQLFAGYRALSGAQDWHHAFVLERALLGVKAEATHADAAAGLHVQVEAVRSTQGGALIGIAGDSLLLRVRRAEATAAPVPWLTVAAGVVRLPDLAMLQHAYGMRALSAMALEAEGVLLPADLGLRAALTLPWQLGTLHVTARNGQGFDMREQNRGKTTRFTLALQPLARTASARWAQAVRALVSYELGSLGPASIRADRALASVLYMQPTLAFGLSAGWAQGSPLGAAHTRLTAEAFGRAALGPILLAASGHLTDEQGLAQPGHSWGARAALGYAVLPGVHTWLYADTTQPSAARQAAALDVAGIAGGVTLAIDWPAAPRAPRF